ncbi:MAG: hypothetical protein IJY86_00480 [Clostridia bacterium]|nr:hypothetical protein [Clostridia bacterium]
MYSFKIKDEPFAVGYLSCESESIYVRTGTGVLETVRHGKIYFDKDTGFASLDLGGMACRNTWQAGQSPDLGRLEQKALANPETAEDYRYIAREMAKVDLNAIERHFTENQRDIIISSSGWGGTWGGHSVPNLFHFALFGTEALRAKVARCAAENPGSADFYRGLELALDAVELLADRICESAREELEKTGDKKLERLIRTFSECPRRPAVTFEEALCVYQMVYNLDGPDSPGHFDQYMYGFWKNSDYAPSRQALEDIWVYFHKTRTWNLCISGSDENWNDLSNDLTYEILDVARKFRFQTPNLTMRCHRNTPEALYAAAAKTLATGIGMPALYNDEVVCPALESLGIPPKDSHLYVMNGCNQIDIQGKSHMGLEDGEVNLALALSYALTNGYNKRYDRVIGLETGVAESFDTFEKFYAAVKAQITHLCDQVCASANTAQEMTAERSANLFRSLCIEGCVEKGLDHKNRGPLYGHGQILWEGGAELYDSLANIKRFVYEQKKYTLAAVRDAILSDFAGQEEMYADFKRSGLNFGNDDPYVDGFAREIMDEFNRYLRKKKTWRGGFYSGGCSPFNRAADYGRQTGALPNGKLSTETMFADSIGATPGRDVKGPTALLNSCLAFDHSLAGSGFILNLKFERGLFGSEKGQAGFIALWKTYFARGGQQLSVTVADRAILLAAKADPDAHRDLIVRVGGYSEYFVNLSAELQENIIARTGY